MLKVVISKVLTFFFSFTVEPSKHLYVNKVEFMDVKSIEHLGIIIKRVMIFVHYSWLFGMVLCLGRASY